jgi:hypothetical protein
MSAPSHLVAHRGKRVIEAPGGHPVHHQFLDVNPAPGRLDSSSSRQFILPLQNLQLVFPNGIPPPETTPAPPIFPRRRSRTAAFWGYPWRPFLGGLFCPAACVAGDFARVGCRHGPLLRIFRPGHRNHASPLFVRQSQRERTLRAQPVVFNARRRLASSRPRLTSDTSRGPVSTKNSFP